VQLEVFQRELTALIGRPTDLRPFVCDGSPLECRAFIVGFNPASASEVDFWDFWTPNGFDKAAWFENYLRERRDRPLKPGKTRRNPISNTRRVIEWILAEASPVKCLETNIYSAATEEAADLPARQRSTAPFDFLLKTIKPSVIVAHGNDAVAHVNAITALGAQVISLPHLSRGWSEARARDVGRQIASQARAVGAISAV